MEVWIALTKMPDGRQAVGIFADSRPVATLTAADALTLAHDLTTLATRITRTRPHDTAGSSHSPLAIR